MKTLKQLVDSSGADTRYEVEDCIDRIGTLLREEYPITKQEIENLKERIYGIEVKYNGNHIRD